MHKHILARSVGLALLASGLLAGCGDKGEAGQGAGEMPPAAVDVVTLHAAPLQLMSELTGRTAPLRVAEVRPQVRKASSAAARAACTSASVAVG